MITCLVISIIFGAFVVWTGPACDGPRTRLLNFRNYPKAKVLHRPRQKGLLVEGTVAVGSPLSM